MQDEFLVTTTFFLVGAIVLDTQGKLVGKGYHARAGEAHAEVVALDQAGSSRIPSIFGGAIITETLFKVNGIGQLLITAIQANDLPMVQTLTFIFAVLIVFFNLIADILYGILDPRIRYD